MRSWWEIFNGGGGGVDQWRPRRENRVFEASRNQSFCLLFLVIKAPMTTRTTKAHEEERIFFLWWSGVIRWLVLWDLRGEREHRREERKAPSYAIVRTSVRRSGASDNMAGKDQMTNFFKGWDAFGF